MIFFNRSRIVVLLFYFFLSSCVPFLSSAESMQLVSRDSSGTLGNGDSQGGNLSANGDYISFVSRASNLVSNDNNGTWDAFVKNIHTGLIERVSVASDGSEVTGADSHGLSSISDNGQVISFSSPAYGLVPNKQNGGLFDVYIHNRNTKQTRRINLSPAGEDAIGGDSGFSVISGNGEFVVYISKASNLVANDTNNNLDIFRYSISTGVTSLVNTNSAGAHSIGDPQALDFFLGVSYDGRYVAFSSSADDLVPGDTNGERDVFRKDMLTGEIIRVSLNSSGSEANSPENQLNPYATGSYYPKISNDGRYVIFSSYANNLIPGDSNEAMDGFLHDCQTGVTSRVTLNPDGSEIPERSAIFDISGDGQTILFSSDSSTIVADDTNNETDLFHRDLISGVVTRVNVSQQGGEAESAAYWPSISSNGQVVSFYSAATNLIPDDTNGFDDVFVTYAPNISNDFKLEVKIYGNGAGKVVSIPEGIDCLGDCEETFSSDINVILNATPQAGSFFYGWSSACAGTANCSVQLSQDVVINATFCNQKEPSLSDVISILKVLTGEEVQGDLHCLLDKDRNGKIGLSDAIYLFSFIAE